MDERNDGRREQRTEGRISTVADMQNTANGWNTNRLFPSTLTVIQKTANI